MTDTTFRDLAKIIEPTVDSWETASFVAQRILHLLDEQKFDNVLDVELDDRFPDNKAFGADEFDSYRFYDGAQWAYRHIMELLGGKND